MVAIYRQCFQTNFIEINFAINIEPLLKFDSYNWQLVSIGSGDGLVFVE